MLSPQRALATAVRAVKVQRENVFPDLHISRTTILYAPLKNTFGFVSCIINKTILCLLVRGALLLCLEKESLVYRLSAIGIPGACPLLWLRAA